MSDAATKILDDRIQAALDKRAVSTDIGGSGGGGMDLIARVQNLEEMVGKIAIDLAEVKGKLSQMPTGFQLAAWMAANAFVVAGLTFAAIRLAAH